jgi:hypothetical protein
LISGAGSQLIMLVNLQLNQSRANRTHPDEQANRHADSAAMRDPGSRHFDGSSTTGH